MKILAVSHEYPPVGGGGANACLFLTKGYAAHGHEVTLVTVWYEGLAEHETVDGVEIYRVKSRRKHKEHCGFSEMLDYLWKALRLSDRLERENHYDVCQVFFGIPSGPVGYWLKKRYGLPYIIRFGGGDIPGFQERFKLVYKLLSPAVKILWKNADALVANSEGLRTFALEFYGRKPVRVIPNGVDTGFFYPDLSKRNPETLNLLFVSRLIERKGLQYLIPELRKIGEQAPKPIHLTVVGDGPYRETLETLAEECKVRNIVTFVGQKDKWELLPYYQAGDIFVFPSKREGMPNAVLEAMACGLPVVMAPCEGSKELIDGNGYIVGADGFADAIVRCMGHLPELSQKSVERVEEHFSWENVVARYLSLMGICLTAYQKQRRENTGTSTH